MINFKPKFHFTPSVGYLNDPNGLIYNRKTKEYHLYFQYSKEISMDEYFGSWVEKNWGHAVSKDLIHWEEQTMAIEHDNIGLIWSGTSVIDRENTIGVFSSNTDKEDRIVSAYACANENPINGYGKICCCIAYSEDGGYTFNKIKENPVVANNGNYYAEAFGDPKIFYLEDDFYEEGGIWVMITVLQVRIFTSKNLKDWTFENEAYCDGKPFYSECPDVFQINIEGKKKWVYSGAGKYYIIGDFKHDEKGKLNFVPESSKIEVNPGNIYATQHFYNLPNDRIINIGWITDHSSLDLKRLGKKYDGFESIPLETTFVKENNDYKVKYYPVEELKEMRKENILSIEETTLEGVIEKFDKIKASEFDLEAEFDISECDGFYYEFNKSEEEKTRLFYTKKKNEVELNTYLSGLVCHEHFHLKVDEKSNTLKIRLLVDTTVIDLFVNDGDASKCCLFFPDEKSNKMFFKVDGKLKVKKLNIFKI